MPAVCEPNVDTHMPDHSHLKLRSCQGPVGAGVALGSPGGCVVLLTASIVEAATVSGTNLRPMPLERGLASAPKADALTKLAHHISNHAIQDDLDL
jgi:hypothetical protein